MDIRYIRTVSGYLFLHSAVQICWISYKRVISLRSGSLPGNMVRKEKFNHLWLNQLAWLCSIGYGAAPVSQRSVSSNPGKPDFFRLPFRNCISCGCCINCEDLMCTYISSFRSSSIWISGYSAFDVESYTCKRSEDVLSEPILRSGNLRWTPLFAFETCLISAQVSSNLMLTLYVLQTLVPKIDYSRS